MANPPAQRQIGATLINDVRSVHMSPYRVKQKAAVSPAPPPDTVRNCMVRANREAERHGHTYIGSLHILIAILDTDPAILTTPWIDATQLRETAAELVSTTPSAGAKQAIENALALAVKYKSGVVDMPHILLGMLTTPDQSVTRLLDRTNIDLETLRIHILSHLSDP